MSNECITYLESILEKQGRILELLEGVTPPTPPTPPLPPNVITVIVDPPLLRNKVPLREIKKLNNARYPIWRVHYDIDGRRICPKVGKPLTVYNDVVLGDGRNNAFRLVPGQIVDGRTILQELYILARHTE